MKHQTCSMTPNRIEFLHISAYDVRYVQSKGHQIHSWWIISSINTATTHPLCHYYNSTLFHPEFQKKKQYREHQKLSWNHLKRLDGHEHTQQRCHLVPEALRAYLPPPNALPGEPANDQPLPSWTSDVPHKSPSNLRWKKEMMTKTQRKIGTIRIIVHNDNKRDYLYNN